LKNLSVPDLKTERGWHVGLSARRSKPKNLHPFFGIKFDTPLAWESKVKLLKKFKISVDKKQSNSDLAADAYENENCNATKAIEKSGVEAQKASSCKTLPAVFFSDSFSAVATG
jgi:hypothetical protein